MNLNGKVFNPGELRTYITLQSRTVTTGSGGFMVPAGTTQATVWAKWENVHGSEVWQAQTMQAVRSATVTIRYRDDIDPTWQVIRDGQTYDIVSLDDIQNRHEYIEMKVQGITAG